MGQSVIGSDLLLHRGVVHIILTSKPEVLERLLAEYGHTRDAGLVLAKTADLDLAVFTVVRDFETAAVISLEPLDLPAYLVQVGIRLGWDKESMARE